MPDGDRDVPFQALLAQNGIHITVRFALHRYLEMTERKIAFKVKWADKRRMPVTARTNEILLVKQFFAHVCGRLGEVSGNQFDCPVIEHRQANASAGIAHDERHTWGLALQTSCQAWQKHEGRVVR